jgi:hypothetical protein
MYGAIHRFRPEAEPEARVFEDASSLLNCGSVTPFCEGVVFGVLGGGGEVGDAF